MHAILQFGGQRVERVAARSGERDGGALVMQRARDRAADGAGGAGHQRGLGAKIEHQKLLLALNAATSSGLLIAVAIAPSAIRLIRPLSTLPAPTS